MANATDKTAVIRENLSDAGFCADSIDRCMQMLDEKRYSDLEKLLAVHRRALLDHIHSYTAQLDCLDYFIYTLKKMMEVSES